MASSGAVTLHGFSGQRARRYDPAAARRSALAKPRQIEQRSAAGIAHALGWLSVGIGIAEIAAPRIVSRMIGVRESQSLLSLVGLRELASGLALLSRNRRGPWPGVRMGGDVIDVGLLLAALRSPAVNKRRVAGALAAVTAVAALDAYARHRINQAPVAHDWKPQEGIAFSKTVTINREPNDLYQFWRKLENLPRFMQHLKSVEATGERQSHWSVTGPAGSTIEWDAEITEDQPGQLIAWRSLPGADVDNFGSVQFEAAKRGTVVRVELQYNPPAGKAGSLIARLFGEEPQQQIDADLRRFKQVVETGEIATTQGQPSVHARAQRKAS